MTISFQSEAGDFCVARASRTELAFVQKEFASRHCTEVGRGLALQFVGEAAQWRAGAVTRLGVRTTGAGARQRQVRAVITGLARNAGAGDGFVDGFCKVGQLLGSIDAEPEDARAARVGEEAIAAERNLKRLRANGHQLALDFFHLLRLLLADEL